MVMTVSNVRRMSNSSEVDGGGIATLTRSADASPKVVPIEEGGVAVPKGLT